MPDFTELKRRLLFEKEALKTYLMTKFHAEDYHGVQDAASDLRDIDCQLEIIAMVDKETIN